MRIFCPISRTVCLPKEVFCLIARIICLSGRRFFVPFLDSLSPERGFLSHFWTLCLPKEAFCPISGIICLPKEVFCPIAGTICFPKEVFLSHCWAYLSPEGGFFVTNKNTQKRKQLVLRLGRNFFDVQYLQKWFVSENLNGGWICNSFINFFKRSRS